MAYNEKLERNKEYAKREARWMKKHGLSEGSYVIVKRKARNYEDGWGAVWCYSMDYAVGKMGKIKKVDELDGTHYGLTLDIENFPLFNFPYTVLDPVKIISGTTDKSTDKFMYESSGLTFDKTIDESVVYDMVTYLSYDYGVNKESIKKVTKSFLDSRVCVVTITTKNGKIFVGSAVRKSSDENIPYVGFMLALDRAFSKLALDQMMCVKASRYLRT